jgi:uncharacterized glyoxalase superfamily protein PhnB
MSTTAPSTTAPSTSDSPAAGGGKLRPARGATPYLVVQGAADALAYYQRVFGAELLLRLDTPQGGLLHAELQVGGASFCMSEAMPERGAPGPLALGGSPVSMIIYVPDADATVAAALASGARATMPLADHFWGDRAGGIVDPFGHQWIVATRIDDPSPEELKRRAAAMFAAMGNGADCPGA